MKIQIKKTRWAPCLAALVGLTAVVKNCQNLLLKKRNDRKKTIHTLAYFDHHTQIPNEYLDLQYKPD